MVLHMVGAVPVKEGTGRIARYELLPLEALGGRPRVDVLCNMSGIFRWGAWRRGGAKGFGCWVLGWVGGWGAYYGSTRSQELVEATYYPGGPCCVRGRVRHGSCNPECRGVCSARNKSVVVWHTHRFQLTSNIIGLSVCDSPSFSQHLSQLPFQLCNQCLLPSAAAAAAAVVSVPLHYCPQGCLPECGGAVGRPVCSCCCR